MAPQDSLPTRVSESIAFLLPWAHGHQHTVIGDFVAAIMEQQTACQAQLARYYSKQEAAVTRVSRLLHHEQLDPRLLADAVLFQALHQLPKHSTVRLAMDWTIAVDQPLLVVSLIVGRRAVPMSWCASDASVLQGRLQRYALAVIRRAVGRVAQAVGKRRVIVTANWSFTVGSLRCSLRPRCHDLSRYHTCSPRDRLREEGGVRCARTFWYHLTARRMRRGRLSPPVHWRRSTAPGSHY